MGEKIAICFVMVFEVGFLKSFLFHTLKPQAKFSEIFPFEYTTAEYSILLRTETSSSKHSATIEHKQTKESPKYISQFCTNENNQIITKFICD